jgi:carbon monoxide dehydrogenase subunit G
MKIEGQYTFEAPREAVWNAVMDPEVIARTIPGCESLEQVGDQEFKGAMKIKIGPVQGQFQGHVTLYDLNPHDDYRLKLKGQGPQGFVDGDGKLTLTEEGGKTTLAYDIDAKVGGRIAGVGQRLVESSAKVVSRQALEALEAQIQATLGAPSEGTDAAAEGDPEARPDAPTQGEFAQAFAKGLIAELIPPEKWPLMILLAVIVLAFLVLAIIYLL